MQYLVLVHINSTSGSKWPPFWKSPLTGQNCSFRFASAPKPIFFVILKTVSVPNFVLLTENEQFKHISAPLVVLQTKWCFWGSLKAKQLILVSKIILTDPYVTSRDLHGRKSYKFGLQVSSSRLCSTRALGSNQRNQRFTQTSLSKVCSMYWQKCKSQIVGLCSFNNF